MLGSILRLAMMAGTGATVAAGFRHMLLKLVGALAAVLIVAFIAAAGICALGVAAYFALAPEWGPAWAAASCGGLLLVLAALLVLIGRLLILRRRRAVATGGFGAGLGGSLGAAALGASMGGRQNLDIKGVLARNAVTVLLTAFIAGMVMNNRR